MIPNNFDVVPESAGKVNATFTAEWANIWYRNPAVIQASPTYLLEYNFRITSFDNHPFKQGV